jgi:hypothetical protein
MQKIKTLKSEKSIFDQIKIKKGIYSRFSHNVKYIFGIILLFQFHFSVDIAPFRQDLGIKE